MPTFCLDYQPAVAQGAGIGRYTRVLADSMPALLAPGERLRLFYCDFRRRAPKEPVPGAEARAVRWAPGAVLQKAGFVYDHDTTNHKFDGTPVPCRAYHLTKEEL